MRIVVISSCGDLFSTRDGLPFIPLYTGLADKTTELLRERTARDGYRESALFLDGLLLRFDDKLREGLDELFRV